MVWQLSDTAYVCCVAVEPVTSARQQINTRHVQREGLLALTTYRLFVASLVFRTAAPSFVTKRKLMMLHVEHPYVDHDKRITESKMEESAGVQRPKRLLYTWYRQTFPWR